MEHDLLKKHSEDTSVLLGELGVSAGSSGSDSRLLSEHAKCVKQLVALVKSMDAQEKACSAQIVQMKRSSGNTVATKELSSTLAVLGMGWMSLG